MHLSRYLKMDARLFRINNLFSKYILRQKRLRSRHFCINKFVVKMQQNSYN